MTWYAVLVLAVGRCERLAELVVAKRNARVEPGARRRRDRRRATTR